MLLSREHKGIEPIRRVKLILLPAFLSSLLLIITHCKTDAFTSYQQEEFLPSEYLTPYDGNNVKMENPIFIKQEIFDDDFSDQHKSKLLQSLLRCKIFGFFQLSFPQNERKMY